jgi:GT2 family glycosyltransferase
MKASVIVCSQSYDSSSRLGAQLRRFDNVEFIPVIKAKSIAKGYNEGAKKATSKNLIFVHDDVKLRFSGLDWLEFLDVLNTKKMGIGGVAGFRKVDLQQHGTLWPPIGGYGSGGCLHESEGEVWYSTYGLFGRTLTVDGIFLAMRKEVFDELEGFDTDYSGWHWYDTDITFRAHMLNYQNFTYPLLLQHGTSNYSKDGKCVDQKEFNKHANIFWKKYKNFLPQVVESQNQELENRVFSREPRWGQVKQEEVV